MKSNRRPAFKEQDRRRRDRRSLGLGIGLVAALLLLTSSYLWVIGAGSHVARAEIGGPFALVQGDGTPVTERSFRGKYLLIYFGYTSCRDVCPTTLTSLAAALDTLGDRARLVQPLFITVDPARDTPEVVQRYANSFMPQLIGLTGTPAELRRVAREYRISTIVHHADGDYAVDHSSVLYLVARDGRMVSPIRADASSADLAKAIAGHLVL